MLIDRIWNGKGGDFYRIANAEGKVWMMPLRHMRVAMNLYQPSGAKGKLLKACFPYVHRWGVAQRAAHARKVQGGLTQTLYGVMCRSLGRDAVELAGFGGTPCVHQKVTVQLSDGNDILGYAKVTDADEIYGLFRQEAQLLQWLKVQGVRGIPQCLSCEEPEQGLYVFVQDTMKSRHSKVLHAWGPCHEAFLDSLERATRRRMLFEESDYYRNLAALLKHLHWLPQGVDASVVKQEAERIVQRYGGRQVEVSAYHADFTPWNMFAENGSLFVFDWEYAQRSYPPGLDRYHFFTQTAIFEKHWEAPQLIRYLASDEGKWMDRERYVLYLMDMMARFTLRERGNVSKGMQASFGIWFDLLQYLRQ